MYFLLQNNITATCTYCYIGTLQYRTSDICKQILLILSRLSDSAPGKRGSYFQAQALYLGLRTS